MSLATLTDLFVHELREVLDAEKVMDEKLIQLASEINAEAQDVGDE